MHDSPIDSGQHPASQGDVALRPWDDGDFHLLERSLGDPVMTRYLGGPETPEQLRKRHERYCTIGDTGTGRMFVITAGEAAEPVGSVGYCEHSWRGALSWETGWAVLPEFQQRGFAKRGVQAALARARATWKLGGKHRFVHAFPALGNLPSNALCQTVGFTLLGAVALEYPPGHELRCNDWRFDLQSATVSRASIS